MRNSAIQNSRTPADRGVSELIKVRLILKNWSNFTIAIVTQPDGEYSLYLTQVQKPVENPKPNWVTYIKICDL
jgi:hypothetical protein